MDMRFLGWSDAFQVPLMKLDSMLTRYRASISDWFPEFLLVLLVLAFLVGMLTACATGDAIGT